MIQLMLKKKIIINLQLNKFMDMTVKLESKVIKTLLSTYWEVK